MGSDYKIYFALNGKKVFQPESSSILMIKQPTVNICFRLGSLQRRAALQNEHLLLKSEKLNSSGLVLSSSPFDLKYLFKVELRIQVRKQQLQSILTQQNQ